MNRVVTKNQRGAALVVGLLLLVVALLLSLSSIQSSRLEESMSGNYRASERALMAAEFGASIVAAELLGQEEGEYADKTLEQVLEALIGDASLSKGELVTVDPDSAASAYYRIEVGDILTSAGGVNVEIASVGEVYSGSPESGELLARRDIVFTFGVDLGIDSPLSFMCPGSYDLPTNADGVVGDVDVENVLMPKPAIAAGGREEARHIVAGIYGLNDDGVHYSDSDYPYFTDKELLEDILKGNEKGGFYFMNANGVGLAEGNDGVYHARGYVQVDPGGDKNKYTVNYSLTKSGCNTQGGGAGSNPLCNFKGGVSTQYGAPALSSAYAFHEFVDAIFNDNSGNVIYHEVPSGEEATQYVDGKINIFTRNSHHVVSSGLSSLGDFSDSPLMFSKNLEAYYSDEEGVEVLNGVDAVLSGGLRDGEMRFLLGGDIVSGLDYESHAVVKNDYRSGVGPWTPDSNYFPSNIDYFSVDPMGPQLYYSDPDYLVGLSFFGDIPEAESSQNPIAPWSAKNDPEYLESGVLRESFQFGRTGKSFGPDIADGVGAVVVIDGNAEWGPSPVVNGILVILGDFLMTGGGVGTYSGAVFGAPYYFDRDKNALGESGGDGAFVCQNAYYDAKGGGGFSVVFSRKYIDNAFDLLSPRAKVALLSGQAITGNVEGWVERMSLD